jgi:tetratricopeptide (TPR) repeat protein
MMKNYLATVGLLLLISISISAQNVVLKSQAEIAIGKAKELLASGKYAEALPILREVVSSDPDSAEGHFQLGLTLQALGQNDAATIAFQKAKELIGITLKSTTRGTNEMLHLHKLLFKQYYASEHLELEKAIDLLRANPTMVIEVGGHTDNVGDDGANMKLSHDRAKAVREYFIAKGIPPERMQAKGYGESSPIALNDTDEGRKANRRTEFIILEF